MDFLISTAFRLEIVKIIFALAILLAIDSRALAHCAMCRATIEQANNSNSTSYLALAALSLFIPALVLFFVMLMIIYKYK